VTSISEITGMEGDVITMQEIFAFEKTGLTRDGKVTGAVPRHRHPAEVQRAARLVRRDLADGYVRTRCVRQTARLPSGASRW
jgi:hypothetical protein